MKKCGVYSANFKHSVSLYPIIILMLFCFITGACSLHSRNHTPPSFAWDNQSLTDPLASTTFDLIYEMGFDHSHRFLLEITANAGISNIHPMITVNGTEHAMTEGPGRLWTYENQDQCTDGYDYYYKIHYRRMGYSSPNTQTIGSASQPLRADVTGFNDVSYQFGVGEVHLPINYPGPYIPIPVLKLFSFNRQETVNIQSLVSSNVRISHIGIVNAPQYQVRPEEFELINVPPLASETDGQGVYINCGERLDFKVRWNGTSPGAKAAIKFCAIGTDYTECPNFYVEAN
jgi:hypothetical protein